jgi:hypothetical protein
VIEELCKDPSRFALNVVAVEEGQREYLEGICDLFRGRRVAAVDDPDLVRRAFEWIQYWKSDAPEATRVSSAVSPRTANVRRALWSTEDPVRVLMQAVPAALEVNNGDLKTALKRLAETKHELDGVVNLYTTRALAVMAAAIGAPGGSASETDVLNSLQQWAEAIPAKALDEVAEPRAKGVVSQLCSPGTDPARLANMISARLTKAVTRWDDTEVAKFQQEFRRIIELVEEAAFRAAGSGASVDGPAKVRLANLVEARIAGQLQTLRAIVGHDETTQRLSKALSPSTKNRNKDSEKGLFHGAT